jgi:hypothetical protein
MSQPALFESRPTRPSPCAFEKHCGAVAEDELPEDLGGCINTEYRCLSCGARGVESVRKDLA